MSKNLKKNKNCKFENPEINALKKPQKTSKVGKS